MNQKLLHREVLPFVHFLQLHQDISVRFEVGRALNHIKDFILAVFHELKTIEFLVVGLLQNFHIDCDIAKVFVHIISLKSIPLLE